MIRLHKGPPPDILVKNAAQWTKEYADALAAGTMTDTVRYRYRHADIKAALRAESHNKCVYCESDIATGETDHIRPVSKCPSEIVVWANLALVCKECNTNKSDYYALAEPLINPYTDAPAAHLLFVGPMVFAVVGDALGLRTQEQLKLNRPDLLQRRSKRLERLAPLIEQWNAHASGATKDILRNAILDEAADNMDYAATVRALLKVQLGWIHPPEAPPPDTAVPTSG